MPSFWKDKVRSNDHGSVDDGENDVRLVSNVGKRNGGDEDNHKVENPVCSGTDTIGGSSNGEGCDFGRIEPSHT